MPITRDGDYMVCSDCGMRVRTKQTDPAKVVHNCRARRGEKPAVPMRATGVSPKRSRWHLRVGTACKTILGWFGIKPGGCKCNSRARAMDRNGAWWCIKHRANIVDWFAAEAEKRKVRFHRWQGYAVLGLALVLAFCTMLTGQKDKKE